MRLLEWYLGLPPARPGQGMKWGISSEPVWSGVLPGWVAGVLLAGIILGVVGVYLRDARSLGWPVRIGLILLRFGSLAVLLLLLLQVTATVTRTGLPTIALLIDTSASMGLDDGYSDAAAAKVAERLSADVGAESASRLNLAQALLTRGEGRFLKELTESHRLKLYEFSSSASPLPSTLTDESPDEVASLLDKIRALKPTGRQTRPGAAVRQVLDDLRGSPPTAVIVLTDGISTTESGDRLSDAAQDARDRSVPLFPIGVGSNEPAKDVQLGNVLSDDVVFVDDPMTFAFQIKAFGYEGESTRVTLSRRGESGVLETTEIKIDAEGQSLSAELTHVPKGEGEFDYVIEAEVLPGETNVQNNSAIRRIQVRREELRVLLVERLPRWEYRHLKTLLERDPTVELHTVLQQADISFSEEDRTALSRFPASRDALMEYDILIWGDVDLSFLNPGVLENVREFVAQRGGGLILIAGERHNPLSYRQTLLEELLPIEIDRSAEEVSRQPGASLVGFRPELTVDGRSRAALRLSNTADENEQVWGNLPRLYWLHESGRRKPAAQVWAVHPTRHHEGGKLPVIIVQRFGAGQVLFHATDELWQWRKRREDVYYGRYWLQMIRYLSRAKLRSDERGIELTTDRSLYEQGDAVELMARFLAPQSTPMTDEGVRAIVEGPGGYREPVSLTRLREAPNLFTGRIFGLVPGSYHAWLSEPALSPVEFDGQERPSAGVPSTDFRVEVSEGEIRDRVFQKRELISAAKQSRGAYYPFWEADRFLEDIPRGRAVPVSSEILIPLWNRWETLILLALLLAAEWISRKRTGLI